VGAEKDLKIFSIYNASTLFSDHGTPLRHERNFRHMPHVPCRAIRAANTAFQT
jgi:hypothetical protein